jgi:adenylate cyclase
VTDKGFQMMGALLLAALWALSLGYAHFTGNVRFLDRAEAALTDLRLLARGERSAPDILTIVAIDDDTAASRGGYPLPRAELAGIIEAVARMAPRIIAVDLLLLDRGNEAGDAALAQALRRHPSVIAAAAAFPDAVQSIEPAESDALARLPRAEKFLLPLKMFADNAATGVVNLTTDSSGTPRGFPMLFRSSD